MFSSKQNLFDHVEFEHLRPNERGQNLDQYQHCVEELFVSAVN